MLQVKHHISVEVDTANGKSREVSLYIYLHQPFVFKHQTNTNSSSSIYLPHQSFVQEDSRMVAFTKLGFAASALVSSAIAHPGDSHEQKMHEAMRNHATAYKAKSSLDACASDSQHQSLMARNVQRRAEQAEALRQKRGISVCRCSTSIVLGILRRR